jgi:hypothetical protein
MFWSCNQRSNAGRSERKHGPQQVDVYSIGDKLVGDQDLVRGGELGHWDRGRGSQEEETGRREETGGGGRNLVYRRRRRLV